MMDATADDARHPIELASRRTGLSKDVLRAWERRYAAVEPDRTDSGRRRYSDEDIERLRLLRRVTEAGRSIGQVAALPTGALQALAREDEEARRETTPSTPQNGSEEQLAAHLEEARQAVLELDPDRLRAVMRRATVLLSADQLIDGLVGPLMSDMGRLWREGVVTPAHEHAATSIIMSMLTDTVDAMGTGRRPDAPQMVVATPAGQRHEIGALLAAATATHAGWHVTYLGADLPAEEIALAARETGAAVVALSIVHPDDDPDLPEELERLRERLGPDSRMVVGGGAAGGYRETLAALGVTSLSDLAELRTLLAGHGGPGGG